jgi:hypothetical protein
MARVPHRDNRRQKPPSAESALKRGFPLLALPLVLALFAVVAYGIAFKSPFFGDDYVFLDKTRDARFADLWSLRNTDFGWYRPWSREMHFWALQRWGLNETAFRAFGALLWIADLSMFAALARRLASRRVAVIATLGVAGLALWGTPLLWISGSQDLWMLCFVLASTLLFVAGHVGWSVVPFTLALLSKETAAVLPAILFSYAVLVEHRYVREAFRRTAHFVGILVVWLAVHPTLHARLTEHGATAETEHRPSLLVILARTLLAMTNLDQWPHPQELTAGRMVRIGLALAVLAAGAAILMRSTVTTSVESRGTVANRRDLTRFALAWSAIAWFPLFLPSIQWHAYYACLGALGAWFGLALWLEDRPRVVVAGIVGLGILRGAQASTLSWDWGTEWYQRRAGYFLSSIKTDLLRLHPALPHHSRVYFGHIPNNIGLIAGKWSPTLRVWYRDTTVRATFYSDYRPRASDEPAGEDFFFRFDSLRGLTEIQAGPEDIGRALLADPDWEANHEKLAMLMLMGGDLRRAAAEFEKLSSLQHRPDAAGYAAVCWEFAGDASRAESLEAAAGSRMKLSKGELESWMARLRASFPRR